MDIYHVKIGGIGFMVNILRMAVSSSKYLPKYLHFSFIIYYLSILFHYFRFFTIQMI